MENKGRMDATQTGREAKMTKSPDATSANKTAKQMETKRDKNPKRRTWYHPKADTSRLNWESQQLYNWRETKSMSTWCTSKNMTSQRPSLDLLAWSCCVSALLAASYLWGKDTRDNCKKRLSPKANQALIHKATYLQQVFSFHSHLVFATLPLNVGCNWPIWQIFSKGISIKSIQRSGWLFWFHATRISQPLWTHNMIFHPYRPLLAAQILA